MQIIKVICEMYQDISIKNKIKQKQKPISDKDKIYTQLKNEATLLSKKFKPASALSDWEKEKKIIYNLIIEKTNINFYDKFPVKMKVTGSLSTKNYTIKNIYFETLPNVFATANLYIPNGQGPFPAVINLHGHIKDGRLDISIQKRAHFLATNGFVCLCMDSFGSGERSEIHGESDYHGSNKGAALLNINETLLGIQISENIRCIDLLAGLDFVDSSNIGVTGESGGGNQAMWLAAIDERIKAVVPVVSVGSFEAFVMEHNCICELLPDGLTFCEEFQILGLIAPRALNIFNALQETHAAFSVNEMVKTATNTGKIYKLYNTDSSFQVQIFNNTHEYSLEMQKAMLIWFNQYLKNSSQKIQLEIPKTYFNKWELSVFLNEKRISKIITQSKYLEIQSNLIQKRLSYQHFTAEEKRKKLIEILHIHQSSNLFDTSYLFYKYDSIILNKKICIEWHCNKENGTYEDINNKKNVESDTTFIELDLYGCGGYTSQIADYFDAQMVSFHTLYRALSWVGKTVIGEWIIQINKTLDAILSINPLVNVKLKARKEAGLAVIFLSAIYPNKVKTIEVEDIPISYTFHSNKNYDYYNMSIHLKGIINWGNIVNALALCNADITIKNAKNIHGNDISEVEKRKLIELHTFLKKHYKTNSNIYLKKEK